MALETGTYISDLVATNPTASDPKSQGDDHLRLVKSTVKATFPNVTGAVTPTHTQLNYVGGVTSALQTQIDTKGAIAGQAWTGAHTFVTQTAGDNSTKAATTAYANAAVSVEAGIRATADSTLQTNIDAKAPISSPALTGVPTAPTATTGTATTQLATTAFVSATAFSAALPSQTGNAGKFVTTDGTNASWAAVALVVSVVSATTQAAVANTHYILTNVAATTVTLPASPASGDTVWVTVANSLATNVIARNAQTIMGLAEDLTINASYSTVQLRFVNSSWRIV